jgi:hypothetical protein
MEVVTVLQKARSGGIAAAVPVPDKIRLLLWMLAIADVMTVAWMLSAGEWLDRSSPVTAVVTLGGHHRVVLWLAVAGFASLALLTVLTEALTVVRRIHVPFIVVSALASAAALSGMLSIVLLVVGAVMLTALVGGALFGGRFVFLSGLFRRR